MSKSRLIGDMEKILPTDYYGMALLSVSVNEARIAFE